MKNISKVIVLITSVSLAGCASIQPKAGFTDVSQQVSQRTGKQVHWKKGGPEDESVEVSVQQLLQNELTADEAIQIALLANPKLQAIYEELGIAQADLVQAGLLRNPIFGTAVLINQGGGAPNLDFSIAWDFMEIFIMPLRKKVAEDNFEATKLRVTGQVMDHAAQVGSAFYVAQANQQIVGMLKQVVSATDASLQAARKMREAGNITELDLDQESTLHYESRLLLSSAEAALMASRERLNKLMGLWGTATQWTMSPMLPEVPENPIGVEDIEKQAIGRSLELAIVRLELLQAAKRAGITKVTSVVPELGVGYIWERDDGNWRNGPGLSFLLPIFDWGQAKRAHAYARIEQLRARYKEVAVNVRSAARSAALNIRMARKWEKYLRKTLLPLRERVTHGMQLEYNAMQVGVFRLLQTRQQQINTGQRYIEALRDYWLARTQVDSVINGWISSQAATLNMIPAAMVGSSEGGQ